MRRLEWIAIASLASLIVAGCGGRDAGTGRGRVVVDDKPALTIPGWRPDGTLGAGDIVDAVRLAGGNIIVSDSRFVQLRRFDVTGRSLRTHAGTAPSAAFSQLSWLGRCGGDSIFVWDGVARNISVLNDTLGLVRSFAVPANTWKVSCNAAGALALITTPKQGSLLPSAQAPELYSTVLLLSPRGDSVATIENVPAGMNRPMAPLTEIVRTAAGVVIGTGDSAMVEVFSDSGRRKAVLPIAIPARAMTAADYQAAIDSLYLAPVPIGPQRDRLRTALAAIPMPPRSPAYRQLFADPAGNVWALVSWPLDSAVVLRGIAPDGAALGEMQLPKGLTVLEVGSDYVLARQEIGRAHV